MEGAIRLILSLSLAGTAMAAALFAAKPLVCGRVSKRFWYYIWLPVLIRLCLPLAGAADVYGAFSKTAENTPAVSAVETAAPVSGQNAAADTAPEADAADTAAVPDSAAAAQADTTTNIPADTGENTADTGNGSGFPWAAVKALVRNPGTWLFVWAAGALLSFGWFMWGYLRFALKLRRSAAPAPGEAHRALSLLAGGGRRPGLLFCPMVGTPMLVGLFRPAIVLPQPRYPRGDMENILRHELSHYRRGDLYFKWLAMLVNCLHWFNPMAYLIRREINRACEPACDEAVVSAMSPAQRRDYGETLLTLAAARRLPVGILATTMSEDKARLKGRLLTVMNYKKSTLGAVALSLALALVLGGCGAALGAPQESPTPVPAAGDALAAPGGSGEKTALTAEELAWFNTEFFNGDYLNIRNQFLFSSFSKPEDIDLFLLFYCGTGGEAQAPVSQAEKAAVMEKNGWDTEPDCPCQKNTVADMDAVLLEYTGLTLAQTNGVGLEKMTYLSDYDAYYYYHGDTNYQNYAMDSGYKDDGGDVYLYFTAQTSRVLHLVKNGDGYLFVSNAELSGSAAEGSDIVLDSISADFPVSLAAEDSAGAGVWLDYQDHERVIFHGSFGLFVYDLNQRAITLAVDLKSAVGTDNVFGDAKEDNAQVVVYDGLWIQLYRSVYGTPADMAYTINAVDGSYVYTAYTKPETGTTATPSDLMALDGRISGGYGAIGDLSFTRDGETWYLFAGYFVPTTPATPGATPTATATPTAASAGAVGDYFPITANTRYVYEGEGNEYASYDVYIDYTSDSKVQQRINNGGTEMIKVLSLSGGKLTRVYSAGETYYRENALKKTGDQEVLLMEPIAVGTSWTLSDGRTRTITSVNAKISTPYGDFEAVEVTTKGTDSTNTDYYARGVGLVKTVFASGGMEVTSSLSAIENNAALTQTVRFFYPNANGDKICYVDKEISFNTNDITRLKLSEAYKEVPAGLVKVFSENTAVNSLYLASDGMVYLDLSGAFLTEMNLGSGYEAMALDAIADTFGYYYGAEKVYLTIDGGLYSSGHIALQKGEYLKADWASAVPAA